MSSCSTKWYHKTSSSIPVMFNNGAVRCEVDSAQVLERRSRSCSALTGIGVSVQTVRNRLHSAGLRARRPYVGVSLSQRHRQARLAWTRQHRRWTNQQWATVLFLLDMLDRRRHGFCWICLTDDVAFGVAEVRGTRTAPLLNMTGMEEQVLWYGAAYLFVPV